MVRIAAFCVLVTVLLSCNVNNTTIDNSIKSLFDKEHVDGCFGLFDNTSGQFTLYNVRRFKDSAYLPASTFKIVNALVGIQTGRIKDDSTMMKWDGVSRSNAR